MTKQRWRGRLRLAHLTAAAALVVAGALVLAGTAAAQPGEHWFDRCVPSFFPASAPDPTLDHYTNGPGPFGVELVAPRYPYASDGDPFTRAALTIDTKQPASSLSRWMTKTTLIAAPGCLSQGSPAGADVFV